MQFTRSELTGAAIIIIIVGLGLAAIRRYQPAPPPAPAENERAAQPEIIMVDITRKDDRAAFAEAVTRASDADGRVQNLLILDLSIGGGREAKVGDRVSVHYIGQLKDGPEFDNSYKRGAPFTFQVGAGEVIAGWEQGIVGMKEGGTRTLVIPPELGYGAAAVGPLPPNATLVFSIELVSIES